MCFALIFPVVETRSLPRTKEALISGIRQFLGTNQGLIQVEAAEDHVYSIVKTLKEPSGVQYILTYQKFFPEFILNIQAFFEEIGTTGIRDSVVYEICRRQNLVGMGDDPFAEWTKDPYDETIREGGRDKVMNAYYKAIVENPKAALVNCIDRCNNLTTMSWGLSRERIYRMITETEKYYPNLLKAIKSTTEYDDAAWLLQYQIESMLDIYKRLM